MTAPKPLSEMRRPIEPGCPGGTGNSVAFIAHTQGWLHCGIPGAAASGVLKAMMQEFERVRPHPRVK